MLGKMAALEAKICIIEANFEYIERIINNPGKSLWQIDEIYTKLNFHFMPSCPCIYSVNTVDHHPLGKVVNSS